MKRILSAIMVLCMLLGTLSSLAGLSVFADEEEQIEGEPEEQEEQEEAMDYMKHVFETKEDKLATMTLMTERYGYQMYYEPVTGEVAVKNVKTGDTFFTNPYDINKVTKIGDTDVKYSEDTKKVLYSQLIIDYVDNTGKTSTMYSFVEAAQRNQIKQKKIKNGIRVEYIMGKQESRSLVPRLITKERLEEQILNNILSVMNDETLPQAQRAEAKQKYNKISAFYTLLDPNDSTLASAVIDMMYESYPITKQTYVDENGATKHYAVYFFNEPKPSAGELGTLESIIGQYAPKYDYEQLQYDHEFTGYKSEDTKPVQFRLALEYTLDEYGLSVRLPANGIRFDQSLYNLENITVLPYAGAGSVEYTGYAFIPDGSGTLIRFEDTLKDKVTASMPGTLYGNDYTYHTLSGSNNQKVMRMPIFGIVEDTVANGTERKSGYLAIIEEGDSLATIVASNGLHQRFRSKYNTVYTKFNPRPKDSYDLSSAVSVSGNTKCTVVSDRKYTGNYKIRYMMLTDMDYASKNGVDTTGCFDASYIGMAQAYRQQLIKSGSLAKLKSNKKQIPLYIETLGVIDVQDTFLSIPVTVKRELTSFEDIKTITNELGKEGINNIVYKLTGYINGGMVNNIPNHIDVEDAAGGDDGLKDLIKFANDKNIGLYLDTDFSYAKKDSMFDGFSLKDQGIKTIDNRYTRKRVYSATLQSFTSSSLIAVSPSVFTDIFHEAEEDLKELGIKSLSLGTIGSDLNSDFDEDDPYNREDSKENIVRTLSRIKESGYSIMMDGGNAYAVSYADHVLNVALDSSNLRSASEAIPMFGLIYHGYINFAGTATNMAGDMRYEVLKIMENGANPYFIMVYRNAEKLKEDEELSSYFSISYVNWKKDLISTYNKLNSALSPVVNSEIKNHEFLIGERVASAEEIAADEAEAKKAEETAAAEEAARLAEEERLKNLEEHLKEKGIVIDPVKPITDETTEDEPTDEKDIEQSEEDTPEEEKGEEGTDEENPEEEPEEQPTDEPEEEPQNDNGYVYTKYTSDDGMIVRVTFENGYAFVLNYNVFDVTVEEYGDTVISGLGYIVVAPDGSITINSGEEAAA